MNPDLLQSQQQPSQQSLISHLDHPLQQLVHKMNATTSCNPIPPVQTQSGPSLHSVLPSLSGDLAQQLEEPTVANSDNIQSTNAIQNLLKQLGVSTEKQSKVSDFLTSSSNFQCTPL